MNCCIGVHGCSLVGVERPTVFGTVLDCMVGSTVLTAVGEFTICVAESFVVKVLTSNQFLVADLDGVPCMIWSSVFL